MIRRILTGPLGLAGDFLQGAGESVIFLLRIIAALPATALRPGLIIYQVYTVGVLSLIIVSISGIFVGMVLGLQGYHTLVNFGAEQSLGVFVALTVVREIGPVITGLLFAGRAGSAIAAEIGLMRATEQIDGMEIMAVDPVKRIAAPRFLAGIISMPLLTAIFAIMAIGFVGGFFIGVTVLGLHSGVYWSQMQAHVSAWDIYNGLIKAGVFGAAVSWIAVYQGFHAAPTSEGVSRATTTTVVISSLAILALDFILTALMFGGT
jgi:phospholipid/cholesterol/gamma-HCH transport system permease protein